MGIKSLILGWCRFSRYLVEVKDEAEISPNPRCYGMVAALEELMVAGTRWMLCAASLALRGTAGRDRMLMSGGPGKAKFV